jgi:hypothetical protein
MYVFFIMKRDCIHYSHSRKDIIDFIKIYQLNLDYEDLSKVELQQALYEHFNNISVNSDLDELKEFLTMSIPTKMNLNIEMKGHIYVKIQRLLFYCRNNYRIKRTGFTSMKEIMEDADFICQWGDLPSVRYVINKLNMDNKVKTRLVPKLSRIPRKNTVVSGCSGILKISKGSFLVKFE